MQPLTTDQLQAIQNALALVDPGGRRQWILEVYSLVDGAEVLTGIIDLRTGKRIKPAWKREAKEPENG